MPFGNEGLLLIETAFGLFGTGVLNCTDRLLKSMKSVSASVLCYKVEKRLAGFYGDL